MAKAKHYYVVSYKRKPTVKAACSLGYLAFQEKRYKAAVLCYKRALIIKKRPELYYNIAIQYIYLKQYDQAIAYLNKALNNISQTYQKQAGKMLIYIYAISGQRYLAREQFQRYIQSYDELDIDMFYIAYMCQEYDFIDRNCLMVCKERELEIQDVELVVYVLHLVGKDKLTQFFLDKCLSYNPRASYEDWSHQLPELLERVKRENVQEFHPDLRTEPILHKKLFGQNKKGLPRQETHDL